MARGRGRWRWIAAGAAVLVLAGGGLLAACSPMALAAPGAVAAVERVVGDGGVVEVRTVDRTIGVSPECSIAVRLGEGVSEAETARILEAAWAAPGESPCVVTTIELASRSSIGGMPAEAMDQDAAAAAAAAMHRLDLVALGASDGGGVVASASASGGDLSTAAALVREAVEARALEEAFGGVRWSLRWSGDGEPYDDVEIEWDATPDAALADLLDGLAALRASGALGQPGSAPAGPALDGPISGLSVRAGVDAGVAALTVDLTAAGWSAADLAAQGDAFASSSRAAQAAEAIAALAAEVGAPPPTITANETVVLVAA
ncbi:MULTISPECIES: hypothetical protein [unclassified Agrococcus]|uniref:hypothetical protein n=1 Tax=unclassified Agrococcus TaxID=2615065 RepID=UPI00361ED802